MRIGDWSSDVYTSDLVSRRPLYRAPLVERGIADFGKGRRQPRDLIHDLGRMRIIPVEPHGIGDELDDLPIGIAVLWAHHLAHALNAAFSVCDGPILFETGGPGTEDMGVVGRLLQEQILTDQDLQNRNN